MGAAEGILDSDVGPVEPTSVLQRSGLTGVPTTTVVSEWWPTFRRQFPRCLVSASDFAGFFGTALRASSDDAKLAEQSDEALHRAFASFENQSCGLLDGLELFAALTLLSRGKVEAKVVFIIDLFDFGGRSALGRDAFGLLVERVASGMKKSCSCLGIHIPVDLPQAMAARLFHGRGAEGEMSVADLQDWWCRSLLVRRCLRRFVHSADEEAGLPDEDEWHDEEYPGVLA
mmetsp:Transcript_128459/g.256609  ORF Transcript_128459/g.256609 Transcript_128459/m.256609 type:complete len:230 (+) Transcript_128459:75-764(+)